MCALVHGPLELVVVVPEDAVRPPCGIAPARAGFVRSVGRGEARVEGEGGRGEDDDARVVRPEDDGREAGEDGLGEVFDAAVGGCGSDQVRAGGRACGQVKGEVE